MAGITIKVGNTEITFDGTPEELADIARKYSASKAGEIEGPVRVGDTIEITDSVNFPIGSRYVVESVDSAGKPGFNDVLLYHSKYRIVARKEETPAPAKPSVKVGDYIVFDEGNDYITAGKAYKVSDKDGNTAMVMDDTGDEITVGGWAPAEYRIITDARELAFAKAGRKLNEFKSGDIVRYMGSATKRGTITEALTVSEAGVKIAWAGTLASTERRANLDLITPAEARVDGE